VFQDRYASLTGQVVAQVEAYVLECMGFIPTVYVARERQTGEIVAGATAYLG